MKSNPLPIKWVEEIFMRLHGRIGNAFFDKYRIGTLNQAGQDIGVENAKLSWSETLAGVSPDQIKAALACIYDYPPGCDDFKKNCVVKAEQKDYIALPAPVSRERNAEYAENVVKFVAQVEKPKRDYRAWMKPILDNPKGYPEISMQKVQEVLKESAA